MQIDQASLALHDVGHGLARAEAPGAHVLDLCHEGDTGWDSRLSGAVNVFYAISGPSSRGRDEQKSVLHPTETSVYYIKALRDDFPTNIGFIRFADLE